MDASISDNYILNAFNIVIPYLPVFFDGEVSIAMTNREEFILNQSCESLQLNNKKGDKIGKGGAAFQAIQTGKVIIKEVGKEVYGIPFRSYAIPIKDDNGEVVGVILAGKSLAKSKEVLEISSNLSSSLEQISNVVSTITQNVQELSVKNNYTSTMLGKAENKTKGTNDILNLIKNIASHTNILGMNAAIEAGRAGESGKGFNVVAQEIRKLSRSTMDSLKQVNEVLDDIVNYIGNVSDNVKEANETFNDQAASLQEISASLQEINTTAQLLKELSNKL